MSYCTAISTPMIISEPAIIEKYANADSIIKDISRKAVESFLKQAPEELYKTYLGVTKVVVLEMFNRQFSYKNSYKPWELRHKTISAYKDDKVIKVDMESEERTGDEVSPGPSRDSGDNGNVAETTKTYAAKENTPSEVVEDAITTEDLEEEERMDAIRAENNNFDNPAGKNPYSKPNVIPPLAVALFTSGMTAHIQARIPKVTNVETDKVTLNADFPSLEIPKPANDDKMTEEFIVMAQVLSIRRKCAKETLQSYTDFFPNISYKLQSKKSLAEEEENRDAIYKACLSKVATIEASKSTAEGVDKEESITASTVGKVVREGASQQVKRYMRKVNDKVAKQGAALTRIEDKLDKTNTVPTTTTKDAETTPNVAGKNQKVRKVGVGGVAGNNKGKGKGTPKKDTPAQARKPEVRAEETSEPKNERCGNQDQVQRPQTQAQRQGMNRQSLYQGDHQQTHHHNTPPPPQYHTPPPPPQYNYPPPQPHQYQEETPFQQERDYHYEEMRRSNRYNSPPQQYNSHPLHYPSPRPYPPRERDN